MSVGKLQPPVIPFMPLLLKDMTFAHEGNKTSVDGLVNFEKMHMMASTMRAVRFCRSRHLGKFLQRHYRYLLLLDIVIRLYPHLRCRDFMMVIIIFCSSIYLFTVLDPPSPKNNDSQIRSYISCFRCVDCQKTLNVMAKKVEPR